MTGIYVRVSTKMQEDNDSVENQKERGIAFARSQGENHQIYLDVESGTNPNRTEWTNLKNDIKAGKINQVWVNELDRSSRNLEESASFWKLCERFNVDLWYSDKKVNFEDEGDAWVYYINGIHAELDIRKIRRRVKQAKAIAKNDGRNTYRQLYGYAFRLIGVSKNKPIREWYPVPEEVKVIRLIYDMYLSKNYSLIKICNEVNKLGCRTKNGKYFKTLTLKNILHQIAYTGYTYTADGELIESKINREKIVSIAEFNQVKDVYPLQTTNKAIPIGRPAEHLASGILHCKNCGIGYFFHDGGRGYFNYYHNNNHNCGKQTNRTPSWLTINYIFEQVYVSAMSDSPEVIYNRLNQGMSETKKQIFSEIQILEGNLKVKKKSVQQLLDFLERGEDESVIVRYEQRKKEIKELELDLAGKKLLIKDESEKISLVMARFCNDKLSEFWFSDEKTKRRLFKSIVESATIDGDLIEIKLLDNRVFKVSYKESMKQARKQGFRNRKQGELDKIDVSDDSMLAMFIADKILPIMALEAKNEGDNEKARNHLLGVLALNQYTVDKSKLGNSQLDYCKSIFDYYRDKQGLRSFMIQESVERIVKELA